MKKLFYLPLFTIILFLLVISCSKKKDTSVISKTVCITVRDYATHQPIEGVSVTIYVLDENSLTYSFTTVSDADGKACFDKTIGVSLADISTSKPGYVGYVLLGGPVTPIPNTYEIFIVKPDAFVKFHIINQPPAYPTDQFNLSMLSTITSLDQLYINIEFKPVVDSTIIYTVVAGNNYIHWSNYRNGSLIKDSSFTIQLTTGDTTDLQIDY